MVAQFENAKNACKGNDKRLSFASSEKETGPVWTIDIPSSLMNTRRNPEIKFLRK